MSLDEQLSQGFVPLPRRLGAAGTALLDGAAEAVLAHMTEKTPERVADVTVWPDGPRLEKAGGATVRWKPDAHPPAVRSLAPVAQRDPALETLWTDDRITDPVRRVVRSERLGPSTSDSASSPREVRAHRLLGDAACTDVSGTATVEAPVGSVLMSPGLIVHRSGPSRAARDRRSFLLRSQPAGHPGLPALPCRAERPTALP